MAHDNTAVIAVNVVVFHVTDDALGAILVEARDIVVWVDVNVGVRSMAVVAPSTTLASPPAEVPAMNTRLDAFTAALRAHRVARHWTQKQAGAAFGVSRSRYSQLEWGHLPSRVFQPHYAVVLQGLDPQLAALFAAAVGRPMAQLVAQAADPQDAPPPLDAKVARTAVSAAIYKAAEAYELSPATARRLAADILEELIAAGLTLDRAAAIARAAANEASKAPASKRAKS